MRRIRVYVDASVFGGVHDDEFKEASRRFLDQAAAGKYVVLVSPTTTNELKDAPPQVRETLTVLPDERIETVPLSAEAAELAQAYIDAGVSGPASLEDASHVAIATVARADLVLSWNFRHLVNYERIRRFNSVNLAQGYQQIEIRSPLEVVYGDEDQGI